MVKTASSRGVIRPPASTTGAPARYTDWRIRPSGQVPSSATATDDGTPWVISKGVGPESAVVANGRLEVSWPASAPGAYYLQAPMASKVRRIGATFGFGPSANYTSGSFCLAAWTTDGAQPGISQAHCHIFTTVVGWLFQIVTGGMIITITQGGYAAPLPQDWSELRLEVVIEGSTAYIYLPDGSTAIAQDSRIGTISGYSPCWEFYRDAGTTTVPLAFYEVWADTRPQPLAGFSSAGLARSLALYPTTQTVISALGSYTPTSEADLAAGTASRRTLGTGGQQAAPGNHGHALGAHASSHAANASDPVTPASIGALAASARDMPNGVAGLDGNGMLMPADIPVVLKLPITVAYAATIQPDVSGGTHFRTTITAAITLNNPTGASDGQRLLWEFVNNTAGALTVSLGTLFEKLATIDVTLSVPAGKVGFLHFVWSTPRTKFTVLGWDYLA